MAELPPSPPRILSIQSHVVSGYVGNRAATFPLQLLGFEVDVLNTVQLSNHTGYGQWKGDRYTPEQVASLFAGLELNGLTKGYTHLLTGYLGVPGNGPAIVEILQKLRVTNPNLHFVLDPVMGDEGKLYVPQEMVTLYREQLAPLASLVTPNGFETQLLSQSPDPLTSFPSVLSAIRRIHGLGVPHVVVTSIELSVGVPDLWPSDGTTASQWLYLIGSTRATLATARSPNHVDSSTDTTQSSSPVNDEVFCLRFPKLDGYFVGTGDLFAGLLSARMDFSHAIPSAALRSACELALATTQAVLKVTSARYEAALRGIERESRQANRKEQMRFAELKLVECRKVIEDPVVELTAKEVDVARLLG
ncbi:hypothetical protein HDU93_008664 [Gonapodya sp. JEL0774]|nr:hypothetical protein HDU93_008664 [Gonapodya sp. JEL0774]